jgi:hypothetical protein
MAPVIAPEDEADLDRMILSASNARYVYLLVSLLTFLQARTDA